ncbi:MAG: hypothetical protein F4220_04685 [Gammaproteobacteria bacterium]|nr:hypothetical protein [Gammaproteobacteria bacterium]
MWLRLRQIALVAEKLAPVEREFADVLGIEVGYRDPGVGHFGLENALMPIGNQLLEVVAPTQDNTAGGRYLTRRGGNGGYMVITQCDDHAPRRARVEALGVRIVNQFDSGEFSNMQLHPKDTGGSFFEIDEQRGERAHDLDGPWEPAGPNWHAHRRLERVTGIAAAEVQCDDPDAVATRWSEIAQIDLGGAARRTLPLDNAEVRFVPCTDGRPEGLGGIDVACADPQAVLQAAEAQGARTGDRQVHLCGMRINLV